MTTQAAPPHFPDATGFTLVDQQESFLIVDKAADQNFHDEGDVGAGFFNQVQQAYPNLKLYPVHRLDKMTSGLLIIATSLESARLFQGLFERHQIEKYYLAISDRKPGKKQGLIKGDMVKSRRSAWKLLRSLKNPAITQFFSYSTGTQRRLFLLRPRTGKTHQIRVAMNSLGSPIIGDPIYHSNSTSERGYLHAYALRFRLFDNHYQYLCPPRYGALFQSTAIRELLTSIGNPWDLAWPAVSVGKES